MSSIDITKTAFAYALGFALIAIVAVGGAL